MDDKQIKYLFSSTFFEDYSQKVAKKAVEANQTDLVYALATDNPEIGLDKKDRPKMVFRAAYVLETIYFEYPQEFEPYKNKFVEDFPKTKNESAKRHFAKMMSHLLDRAEIKSEQAERIAEACLKWISEPKVRVAVQIWAFEVLIKLKDRVEWISMVLPEVIDLFRKNPTPAIKVRLKGWKKLCI